MLNESNGTNGTNGLKEMPIKYNKDPIAQKAKAGRKDNAKINKEINYFCNTANILSRKTMPLNQIRGTDT
ncbi:hypothetical protein BpHYR1_017440 [Brachionus plicatilis]|uniref:Uncharacterized protein n=1 Tax=Brachionus plicatilis TaxID=10195 RepID=A0A3M7R3K9_BRAPC|nr:hypothetical protein BpHYR1_017440 [Brachionus plicatilis]